MYETFMAWSAWIVSYLLGVVSGVLLMAWALHNPEGTNR